MMEWSDWLWVGLGVGYLLLMAYGAQSNMA